MEGQRFGILTVDSFCKIIFIVIHTGSWKPQKQLIQPESNAIKETVHNPLWLGEESKQLSPYIVRRGRQKFSVFTKSLHRMLWTDLMDRWIYGISGHKQTILLRSDVPGFRFRFLPLKRAPASSRLYRSRKPSSSQSRPLILRLLEPQKRKRFPVWKGSSWNFCFTSVERPSIPFRRSVFPTKT